MNNDQIDTDEDYSKLKKLLLAVFLIWLVAAVVISTLSYKGLVGSTGQFGNAFGILNTLFSGLAFAVLIYTIHQQKQELRLQRLELQQTRDELRGQKDQLTIQNRTLTQQRFESTFFQMIRLHHEIVRGITTDNPFGNDTVSERQALRKLANWLSSQVDNHLVRNAPNIDHAINIYSSFYVRNQHALAHYFRNLYRILKLVHESGLENKRSYAGLLRAQLSHEELVLLFFNGLGPYGKERFKPLIEEYAFLEHIPSDSGFMKAYGSEYNSRAFGSGA